MAKKAAKKQTAKKAAPGRKRVTKEDIAKAEGTSKVPASIKLPSANFISKLVKTTLPNIEEDMVSLRGDIGSTIANAVEKNNVEKRALAIARRLHKMPDRKFQETWFHLLHYAEALGFQARADKQGQLELEQTADDGGEDDGEGDENENAEGDDAPLAGTNGKSPAMRIVPKDEEAAA